MGMLGKAKAAEEELDKVLRRKAQLEAELANIPAKLNECEQRVTAHSLERWRVK